MVSDNPFEAPKTIDTSTTWYGRFSAYQSKKKELRERKLSILILGKRMLRLLDHTSKLIKVYIQETKTDFSENYGREAHKILTKNNLILYNSHKKLLKNITQLFGSLSQDSELKKALDSLDEEVNFLLIPNE